MSFPRNLPAIALAAALFVPLAASAQQNPPPTYSQQAQPQTAPGAPAHGHHRHGGIRQALKRLDLSPDQRRQIAGIMKQTRLANQNADQPTRRANNTQMRAQINGVLTADQQTQLKHTLRDMRRAHDASAPAGAPHGGPPPAPQNPG